MSWLVDNLSRTLERSMDLRVQRQTLIASNLANLDTPDYQPVDLSFQDTLDAVLAGEDTVPEATPLHDPTATPDANGNGVDLDREMGRMASNSMLHAASIHIHRRRGALLRHAISEGSK